MAKDFFQSYEVGSAKERAEIIYENYCSFEAIIDDFKAGLIYDIQSEEEFSRSHYRDELGVRIQKLGHYDNPTAEEAVNNWMLEQDIDGNGEIHISGKVAADAQEKLRRKHHVLIVMREEYAYFAKHINALKPKEKQIILPLLNDSKDHFQLAQEFGVNVETIRKRASRIHKEVIEYMGTNFRERI